MKLKDYKVPRKARSSSPRRHQEEVQRQAVAEAVRGRRLLEGVPKVRPVLQAPQLPNPPNIRVSRRFPSAKRLHSLDISDPNCSKGADESKDIQPGIKRQREDSTDTTGTRPPSTCSTRVETRPGTRSCSTQACPTRGVAPGACGMSSTSLSSWRCTA